MSKSTVFVDERVEKTVKLGMEYSSQWYIIEVPKSWLKKNPQYKWQYILPDNVKSLRIVDSLYGIDIDDLQTYPTNNYIKRLFTDESSYT